MQPSLAAALVLALSSCGGRAAGSSSASQPTLGVEPSRSPTPAAPTACPDARSALESRAHEFGPEGMEGEVTIVHLGDLNGDGLDEVGANYASRAITTSWIASRTIDRCYADVLADGPGMIEGPLQEITTGWLDVGLAMTLNGLGGMNTACAVRVRARFDGKKYVPRDIVSVQAAIDGGEVDLVACRKQAEEMLRSKK